MKFYFVAILFAVCTFCCVNTNTGQKNLLSYMPQNSTVIIKTNSTDSLTDKLNIGAFFKKPYPEKTHRFVKNKLDIVQLLDIKEELLLSLQIDDSINFTLATKLHKKLIKTENLSNYKEESFIEKGVNYKRHILKNTVLYSTIIDSVFIASTQINTLNKKHFTTQNNSLNKAYSSLGKNSNLHLILNSNDTVFKSPFINKNIPFNKFASHIAVDVNTTNNKQLLNGVVCNTDSTKNFINIFKNTIAQENQIFKITPKDSDGVLSFTFNDFITFKNNLNAFSKKDTINTAPLLEQCNEIGVIYKNNKTAIVLNTLDAIATKEILIGQQNIIENYRQVNILNYTKASYFKSQLWPLITDKATKYAQLDHFFIFSDDINLIKHIIKNHQNKSTLVTASYYQEIKAQLSSQASLMQILTPKGAKKSLHSPKSFALQFITDSNFYHINGITLNNTQKKEQENSTKEVLQIKLEADINTTPQFVKNHITKQKDILVQDVNNNLYLITNTGKILWKKHLKNTILGKVKQIDIYKNGKLQLAFTTKNHLHIIDKNGNNVNGYPMEFKDDITQPLSIFDYDNNKKYRLVVTQNKSVIMLDSKGKLVKGFTFKKAKNTIITAPKHLKIGNKDYIVLKTEKAIYILNRLGKTRVKPKTKVLLSNQDVYIYNNKFITTTKNGKILTVDAQGNTATQNLKLNKKHYIQSTNKTLVTHSDNILKIKSNTLRLDYGNYTNPELFIVNNKIYVSITDLQAQKIYLYNSKAKLLNNFPVYGTSKIDLDNIDKNKKPEFITTGAPNTLILYKIN